MVERVTGRMNLGRAALSGALSGMWFGLMIGLLWVIVGAPDLSPVVLGVTPQSQDPGLDVTVVRVWAPTTSTLLLQAVRCSFRLPFTVASQHFSKA